MRSRQWMGVAIAMAALVQGAAAQAGEQVLRCETRNLRIFYRFADGDFFQRAPNQSSWSRVRCNENYNTSTGCQHISSCMQNGDTFFWDVIQTCGSRGAYSNTRINVATGEMLLESDYGRGKTTTPGNCTDVTSESAQLPIEQPQPQAPARSYSPPAYTYQPPTYAPPPPMYRPPSVQIYPGMK